MKTAKIVLTCSVAAALLLTNPALAAVPSPEKLLPDDTLFVVTAPDFTRLSEAWKKSPQAQAWNDPAMKAFKDKFLAKWDDELVKPLERELDIKFADYTALLQGQLTFAITQNGWKGQDEDQPGLLLLVDAKDKREQLKKNLATLRKKWVDGGKSLKTEKIRDFEFSIVTLSSNDVPKTLRKLFPKSSEVQELGDDKEVKKSPDQQLVIGQADSLLLVGNSVKAVERIVVRLQGGSVPSLGELAAYQQNHLALFRDSPFYGWANVKRFMDILVPVWSEKKDNPDAPNPFDTKPDKVLTAVGLSALKTVAFSLQTSSDGSMFQLFCSVPEADRQGLFKILAGVPKEANPPPFVPADALKFQRWRIDGRKAWATLEKSLNDISPQAGATINFLLDSANNYAQEKDPGFDIRKNLIDNLGDDIINYQKAAQAAGGSEPVTPSSLFLIGSPNPEQFVGALKGILVFLNRQGSAPQEREFLGRKIISVPIAIPGRASGGGKPSTLHYAASSRYVALSTDASLVEEYLRTCDSQPKALRELPGLADAAQKVLGPNSSLFGYQNDAENMRATLELLKKTFASSGNSGSGPSLLPVPGAGAAEKLFKEWLDCSLLPSFDRISKYFYFSVYGGSATIDGLSLKMYSPVPPGLKH